MTKTENIINKNKGIHRNSYSLSPKAFRFVWWGSTALFAASLFQPFFIGVSGINYGIIFIAIAAATFLAGYILSAPDKEEILPYKRCSGFNFLGLHDLSNVILDENSSDVIKRDEEVEYIYNVLENIIFPQGNIKQTLCITGKSGCGKSTILAFLQQKYSEEKDKYMVYNFSGNYNNLKGVLEENFGDHISDKISNLTIKRRKIIFILDQFERYFFLTAQKQKDIRKFIEELCQKNTAVIVSLREEYLAEFLKEFDLNDIKSNSLINDEVTHHGLLRDLVGYIKDTENYVVMQSSRSSVTYTLWKNEHIKNPERIHILDPISNGVAEFNRPGITLFYCENQSFSSKKKEEENNNKKEEENKKEIMKEKCEKCFKPEIEAKFYEKYRDKPLIEQEIVFHMAEYDQKIRNDENAAERYINTDNQDILKRYFDIQLSATGDYFNALRIMYILSSARLHQISMKTSEIETGLFADQFSKKGAEALAKTMAKLEELQLIKRSMRNSQSEYEISHDFIAKTFTNYCSNTMDRNVKEALDIYLSDYLVEYERSISVKEDKNTDGSQKTDENKFYIRLRNKISEQNKDNYYKVIACIFAALIILTDLFYRIVWNPWQDGILKDPVNGFFACFIPIHLIICFVYFYQMFDKVFKFYNGKHGVWLKVIYFFMGLITYMSELFYPHFLSTNGTVLFLIGATGVIILSGDHRETSKNALRRYGAKCMLMGGIYALAHIMVFLYKKELTPEIIILEVWVMAALTAFAHLSHMSAEYLYGRRMDVSEDKGKS